ncbi:hypothetical protein A4X06_0g3205 [Tilletia controversa]|uniref:Glycosyltransferase family 71 protein n=1 Tax=Tilletia controversa TaxID=13291 RepID=A0A8X7MW87_9BASI|nr:hypothetical protein CF328_g2544 [Tilletia controversa]KAE8249493.1 hypothetical protein A4X06_0g3205 [Tilletia controversa]
MVLGSLRVGRVRLLGILAAGSLTLLVLLFYTTSSDAAFLTSSRLRQHLPSWVLPQPEKQSNKTQASPSTKPHPVAYPKIFIPTAGPNVKVPSWMLPPKDKPEEPEVFTFPPNPADTPPLLPASIPSSKALQDRLQAFLDAPAPSRRTSFMINIVSCSRSIFQADDDQVHLNREYWNSDTASGPSALRLWRSRLVRSLERAARRGEALVAAQEGTPLEGSKGLVYAPRSQQDVEDTLTSLRWLRSHLKSPVKVEVWYSAAPSSHLNLAEARWKSQLDALTALRAHVRALPPHVHATTKSSSSSRPPHIRAAAMLASSFTKVLFLDGTSLSLQDPLSLFTSSAFLKGYPSPEPAPSSSSSKTKVKTAPQGPLYTPNAVLWPGIHRDSQDNPIWRFVGTPCTSDHWQIDAGQMLLDKRGNGGLNLAVLHVAAYMQDASEPKVAGPDNLSGASTALTVDAQLDGRGGAEFFTRVSADGQEALRYAFMVLGLNYTSAPIWPSFAGNLVPRQGAPVAAAAGDKTAQSEFCGHALVQFDLETEPYIPPVSASKSFLTGKRGPITLPPKKNVASPLFLHLNLTSAFLRAHPNVAHEQLFTHVQSFAPNKLGDRAFEEVSAGVQVTKLASATTGAAAGGAEYGCLKMKPHKDPNTIWWDQERKKLGLPPAEIKVESVALLQGGKGDGGSAGTGWEGASSWISAYWTASASSSSSEGTAHKRLTSSRRSRRRPST